MRTYPIVDDAGLMFAVEVDNAYISIARLAHLLVDVNDVRAVQARKPFSTAAEILVTFEYRGVPFVVMEPYGDNSRYWIGPDNPDAPKVDVSGLEKHLRSYRVSALWKIVGDLVSLRFISLFRWKMTISS